VDSRTEKPAHNSGFALWGLAFFVETFVQGSIFLLRMNSSAKNPPQRKAAERYGQVKNKKAVQGRLTTYSDRQQKWRQENHSAAAKKTGRNLKIHKSRINN
jgi:hypothetical protein